MLLDADNDTIVATGANRRVQNHRNVVDLKAEPCWLSRDGTRLNPTAPVKLPIR